MSIGTSTTASSRPSTPSVMVAVGPPERFGTTTMPLGSPFSGLPRIETQVFDRSSGTPTTVVSGLALPSRLLVSMPRSVRRSRVLLPVPSWMPSPSSPLESPSRPLVPDPRTSLDPLVPRMSRLRPLTLTGRLTPRSLRRPLPPVLPPGVDEPPPRVMPVPRSPPLPSSPPSLAGGVLGDGAGVTGGVGSGGVVMVMPVPRSPPLPRRPPDPFPPPMGRSIAFAAVAPRIVKPPVSTATARPRVMFLFMVMLLSD